MLLCFQFLRILIEDIICKRRQSLKNGEFCFGSGVRFCQSESSTFPKVKRSVIISSTNGNHLDWMENLTEIVRRDSRGLTTSIGSSSNCVHILQNRGLILFDDHQDFIFVKQVEIMEF